MRFVISISFVFLVLLSFSFTTIKKWEGNDKKETISNTSEARFKAYVDCFYESLNDNSLNYTAFEIGLRGYLELKAQNKLQNDRYLTIIDMSVSANLERFFLIDVYNQQVVYKTLVAHGANTGEEFASDFSNEESSHKSSIGFYLTGETYNGKHDFSLKLDGLEFSNSNARERGIVIHAADYVSYDFIQENGRLGRSYGCPALPHQNYFDIISKIKNNSCLFIYYPSKTYFERSLFAKVTPTL